jgi:hypothetical protein
MPRWARGFREKIEAITGEREFTYCLAITPLARPDRANLTHHETRTRPSPHRLRNVIRLSARHGGARPNIRSCADESACLIGRAEQPVRIVQRSCRLLPAPWAMPGHSQEDAFSPSETSSG